MNEPQPAPANAFSSVTGAFSDLIKAALPVAQTVVGYKTAAAQAKAAATNAAAQAQTAPPSYAAQDEADWRAVVTQPAPSITAAKWFPFAIGGGVLLMLGIFVFALKGARR